MRKFVALFCIFALLMSAAPVKGATESELDLGNITCSCNEKNELSVISYHPSKIAPDYEMKIAGVYGSQVKRYYMKEISDNVFADADFSCVYLQNTSGLTIGDYAFQGAEVKEISGSSVVKHNFEVVGEGSVTEIGKEAFDNMKVEGDLSIVGLKECSVGQGAFQNITVKGRITLAGSIDTLGDYAFARASAAYLVIPKKIRHFGKGVFQGMNLVNFEIGEEVESLGSQLFEGCNKLKTITLPQESKLTDVAEDAFPNKEDLTVIIKNEQTDLSLYHFEKYSHIIFRTEKDIAADSPVMQFILDNRLRYQQGEEGAILSPGDSGYPKGNPDPTTASGEGSPSPDPTATPGAGSPSPDPTATPGTESPSPNPTTTPGAESPDAEPTATPKTERPDADPTATPGTESPSPNPTATPGTGSPSPDPTATPGTESPFPDPTTTPGEGSVIPGTDSSMTPGAGGTIPSAGSSASPVAGTVSQNQGQTVSQSARGTAVPAAKEKAKSLYIGKGIQYRIKGKKNMVSVAGCTGKIKSELKIPNTVQIDGRLYKVVEIEPGAFRKNRTIQKAILGNYITKVGKEAFAGCTKLKKIQFGTGMVKLGAKALKGDKHLKKIVFRGKKVKSIGKKAFYAVPKTVVIIAPKSRTKRYKKLIDRSNA